MPVSVKKPALLVLEDGTVFRGVSCGAEGETFGEVCFNTSLVGYQEIISDPSYAGQIVTMTYPHIGNYGVDAADMQSDALALRGLVVRSLCTAPSNFRSERSLSTFLTERGIVAIEEVDTRRLTRHIRDHGMQRAVISTLESDIEILIGRVRASEGLVGRNLAQTVSCAEPYDYAEDLHAYEFVKKPPQPVRYRVVAYDCGIKKGILRGLREAGCEVTVVPWNTPASEVLALDPDGVFFSNGPGDPEPVAATYEAVRALIGQKPVFGICLGNQMIAMAAGSAIEKLRFGHHGGNQPVMNLRTGRVEITAQNHGFGLVFSSLGSLVPELSGGYAQHADDLRFWSERRIAPVVENARFGRIQLTHINLNDGTAEGIAFLDQPVFSVQYHPEASPGPTDASYLFTAFTRLMDGWTPGDASYLDIDISADRLTAWA
jgi:carbamoyl-phosphate synthase small subunit